MTDTIGQQLRQARQDKHLSLEDIALTTRIRLHYLQALEADDFAVLPSDVQVRGFLRAYTQALGLPFEPFLKQLQGLPLDEPQPDGDAGDEPGSDLASPTREDRDSSLAIFQDLGERLRRQRNVLGISLEEVERQTHIRLHYLQALEQGRLEELPSPVQGRGMLSGYAEFLGMNPEALLLLYADGLQERLEVRRRQAQASAASRRGTGRSPTTPGPIRRLFSSGLVTAGILVVFLVGFIIWAALRVSQMQTNQVPTSTPPSVADVLAQDTATPTASQVAAVQTTTPEAQGEESTVEPTFLVAETEQVVEPTATFPAAVSGRIQLYLVARQRAWVRVTVDGEIELEGRVVPGSAYLFDGDDRVELLTGNGAALQVFLNREDLGPLGIYGQVVQRVFTPQGMQTPTPLVPPTSTPEPSPTVTSTGEVTPVLSQTAGPTSTEAITAP